jgi:hypothetical protein
MLVIISMIVQSNPIGSKFINLISRIKHELVSFDKITIFHIKRDLNFEADCWANFVLELSP